MTDENAFEKLRLENEAKFESVKETVKSNIEGRKDIWTLIGELIELFVPKVITTFFGSKDNDQTS